MESLTESEFKAYVVKKAKEYIFGTTDNLKEESAVIKESVKDDVTLDSVKDMVAHLKKVNASLSFNDPSIKPEALNESKEPARGFKVGSYENESIELKETLSETMNNYNKRKSLKHGDESQKQTWGRLVEHKKYEEDK